MNQADAKAMILAELAEIAPEADFARLPGKAQLRDELDIDSIDFLNFITALHERTGIDIPEADYGQLATLDDAIAYLTARA